MRREVREALVIFCEREFFADQVEQFLFALTLVAADEGFFLLKGAAAASEGVDGLSWHLIDCWVERLGHEGVELIVLEEIVGSLAIAVGGKEPSGEGAIAVEFEDFLSFFDSLAVEDDGLIGDRFDLGCDEREIF